MKSFLRRLSSKRGQQASGKSRTPYQHLKLLPRYQQAEIELFGQPFRVADGMSFYYSYKEIFQNEIYRFLSARPDPVILDCGSNYGASIVYFKSVFPKARITGIEADPNIFKLLSWNIGKQSFTDVVLLNKAVAPDAGVVQFHSEGADGGRIHALEACHVVHQVEAVVLDSLIEGPVDFLKMDIEGAEVDVICSSARLGQVGSIFIEYHSFEHSPQRLGAMLEHLASNGFRYYIHTQFCAGQPLIEKKSSLGMDLQLNIFATKLQ